MKIAVLLNCHDYPNLVLDTLESIRAWVSNDILVMIDSNGWRKFSFIHWGNTKVLRGLYHNYYKSPYRNITHGLKHLYEMYPEYDWYVYVEYDCIFTSDTFLSDLKNKKGIVCLANDIRHHSGSLPFLDSVIGSKINDLATMLGCCVFYSRDFIKKLYDMQFYDKFIKATEQFKNGFFPDYKQYAFEETLFPSLVKYFGGSVYELGAWRRNAWTDNRYPMRFRPDISLNDLPADSSIVHPLKRLVDCPVRTRFKIARNKYLAWNNKVINSHDISTSDKKLQYIITGTGRCGTVYLMALFNSIGISCGHERIFTNIGCSYRNYGYNSHSSTWAKVKQLDDPNIPLDAESSYMAAPYMLDDFLSGTRIVHIVRDPIDVINSFVNGMGYFKYRDQYPENPYEQFILKYIPDLIEINNPLLKAAYFYIKWNQLIELAIKKLPYFRFCIEGNINNLLDAVGKNGQNHYNNKKCNSIIEKNGLTWSEIPNSSVKDDLVKIYKKYYNK